MDDSLVREIRAALGQEQQQADSPVPTLLGGMPHEQVSDLEGLIALIRHIAATLGQAHQAEQLIEEIVERLEIITHKLKFIQAAQRPQVLLLESIAPYRFAGNDYFNQLVHMAGGKAMEKGSMEDLNPGVLIVQAKGSSMISYLGKLPQLLELPEWRDTDAVKNNKVYTVESSRNLTLPSVKMADQVELLAQLFFPQYFVFEEAGNTWLQFDLAK